MKHLNPLELSFFALESVTRPMHAGGVLLFEPEPGQTSADLAEQTVSAFIESPPTPPWNQRPVLGLIPGPHWETAPSIDIRYHVRRITLPAPGSMDQLMELVSGLYPALLDRSRPMWELYLIDGLEKDRMALFFKIHHALADGAAGLKMFSNWLQETPQRHPLPLWAEPTEQRKDPDRRTGSSTNVIGSALRGIEGIVKAAPRVVKVVPEIVRLVRHAELPFSAARTARMAAHMSSARSFAGFDIPLGEARQIREQLGGTVNDVLLAVCDEAMQRYQDESGAGTRTEAMTTLLAVSTRRPGQDFGGGNAVAGILVKLGAPQATPGERLEQVIAATTKAKALVRATSGVTLQMQMMLFLGAMELREQLPFGRGVVPNFVNFALSNLQGGLERPCYLGTAELTSIYVTPIVPASQEVNFTAMPCRDFLCVGIGAARNLMPDSNRLAELATAAFEDLRKEVLAP